MSKTINRLTPLECKHPAKPWLNDGNGLWLRSGADGRRTKSERQDWIYRFVSPITSKPRKLSLGPYPQLGLAAARQERDRLTQRIRDGLDPTAEKLAARAAPRLMPAKETAPAASPTETVETFAGLAERFLAAHATDWRGEHTLNAFNRRARRVVAVVGDKPVWAFVADKWVLMISVADVLAVVEPLWVDTRNEGMETLRVLRRVIGFGLASKHMPQTSNPATWDGHLEYLLPGVIATTNYTPYPWAQAPALWRTLMQINHPAPLEPFLAAACPALAWMLSVGCRGAEARRLRWGFIDLNQNIVRYPATIVDPDGKVVQIMKGNLPWWQPLNDAAMQVLDLAGRTAGNRDPDSFVFKPVSVTGDSGTGRSKTKHAAGDGELNDTYLWDCLHRISPDYPMPHGLRSCLRMWLADNRPDCPEYLAEACIAHTFGTKVQRAYQQSRLVEAKRPFMAAWGSYLMTHNTLE